MGSVVSKFFNKDDTSTNLIETKKIFETLPDNSAIFASNSNSTTPLQQSNESLLELMPTRFGIDPTYRMQLNAATEWKLIADLDDCDKPYSVYFENSRYTANLRCQLENNELVKEIKKEVEEEKLNILSSNPVKFRAYAEYKEWKMEHTRYITSDHRHIADIYSCDCSNNSVVNREIMPKVLYVSNMDRHFSEERIASLFEKVGMVLNTKLRFDANGNPYAFVEFYDPYTAHRAHFAMNNKMVNGLEMKVKWANKELAANGKCYYYVESLEEHTTEDRVTTTSMNKETEIDRRNVHCESRSLKMVHNKKDQKLKPYDVLPSTSK